MMVCINGQGRPETHHAEGWLCAPDGRQILPMCRRQAMETIAEYRAVLGERWTFKANLKGATQ